MTITPPKLDASTVEAILSLDREHGDAFLRGAMFIQCDICDRIAALTREIGWRHSWTDLLFYVAGYKAAETKGE